MKNINNKNQTIIFTILLISLFLLIQIIIKPENMFISDPLVKAVQTFSLKFSNYSSQQVYYPAVDLDPKYELSPLTEGFIFYNNGKYIGTFPVATSFIYSLLDQNYLKFFPYFNSLFLLPLLYLIQANSKQKFTSFYLLIGTILFPTLIDFSENSIYYLLIGSGFYILIKSFDEKKYRNIIVGSLLISLSIWFRLESLIFLISLLFSILIISTLSSSINQYVKYIFIISILSIFSISIFFLYNHLTYTSILGPRFLFNFKEVSFDIQNKIIIFLSILFTYPRVNNIAIGFYLYSPIFILIIYYFTKKFKENSQIINLNLLTIVIFSLLIGVLSPNDGVTITGRYLACGVFPLAILLDQFLIETQGMYRYFKIGLLSLSFIITTIIIFTFHVISKEFKKHSNFLNSLKSDLFISSNELIGGSFSLGYLDKKIITTRNGSDIKKIESIVSSNNFGKIYLIGYKKSSNLNNNLIDELYIILNNANYICTEENELIYKLYNCTYSQIKNK